MQRTHARRTLAAAMTVLALGAGCAGPRVNRAQVVSPAVIPTGPQVVRGDVVPAGTTLAIRVDQAIGTDVSHPGQRFTATVVTPVVDAQGRAIIPAGAQVMGHVVALREGNQVDTPPMISLAIDGVRVRGVDHPLRASVVNAEVEVFHRGVRGRHVAGAAAGGAILGALVGDLRGAVTGGALGAGAGAVGSYLAADRHARIPVGGQVTIRLESGIPVVALRTGRPVGTGIGGGP